MFAAYSAAIGAQRNTIIKSITEIEIVIGAGATEASQAIAAGVDMDKAVLLYPHLRIGAGATNSRDGWHPMLVKDSAGQQVTAKTKTTATGVARTVRSYLIEFMPWVVKKIEARSGNETGTQESITDISVAATTDLHPKVALFPYGHMTDNASQALDRTQIATFANSYDEDDNLLSALITREDATGSVDYSFETIEFNEGVLFNSYVAFFDDEDIPSGVVETTYDAFFKIFSGTNDTGTWSRSWTTGPDFSTAGITLDHCLFLFNGFESSGGFQDHQVYLTPHLTAPSMTRQGSSSVEASAELGAIPFSKKWVKNGESGVDRILATAATEDVTISAIDDLTRAVASFLGMSTDNAAANVDRFPATLDITSTTNLRLERGASASTFVDVGWSVLQFR